VGLEVRPITRATVKFKKMKASKINPTTVKRML